jgi:hypothetical protein
MLSGSDIYRGASKAMDEKASLHLRNLMAGQLANRFMIEKLLTLALFQLEKRDRLKWAESMLEASIQTKQFAGIANGDEAMAANLSEMVIEFQEQVDQTIGKILKLIGEAEVAGAAEFYRKHQKRPRL